MIEKKLEQLFSELTQEEILKIEKSDIDTECDIDPKIYSLVMARVRAKTQTGNIPVVTSKKQGLGKRFRALLVAAAVIVVLTIGAGAAYTFLMPEGLQAQLELNDMRIKTVVDTETADEDSVKTMQKTVSANGYTVTFEAIVDGNVILPEFIAQLKGYEGDAEIREDRIYAIMTITRDDGKNVIYPDGVVTCFCCDCFPKYAVAVKGYVPNSAMFISNPNFYEEGNVLYLVCDITEAGIFADRDLSIIIYDEDVIDDMIVRMDEKGDYYFADTYEKIGAMFDFDLDDSLADPEAVAKDMAERPYIYITDPDYTELDEMIAKDEALKKVDLSYAIGNHEWRGFYPLQFGEAEHSEDFIELFKNNSKLEKTGFDAYNQAAAEASETFDAEYIAHLEQLSGKSIDTMTDDELNDLGDEMEAFEAENGKISAQFLKERFSFTKFDDGSEYCYIDEFIFLYIPADCNEAKIVIVYGDRIVISLDCTVDCMSNINFPTQENVMPGTMYDYRYLFGVDEESRYAVLYNEEEYKIRTQLIRDEYDAIFSLVKEFTYYDGTVQVFNK